MKRRLIFCALFFIWAPQAAFGQPLSFRATVEGGASHLAVEGLDRRWGGLGGASLGLGITDLISFEVFAQYDRIEGGITGTSYGFGLSYHLDVSWVAPFIEAGLAASFIDLPDRPLQTQTPAWLGGGVDVRWFDFFVTGVVFRYFSVFETALTEPGLSLIRLRVGIVLEP